MAFEKKIELYLKNFHLLATSPLFLMTLFSMSKNNTIEISLNKAKLSKLLIFSIIFLTAGLWMIISDPQTSNPFFNNPIIKGFAAYGGALLGLLGIYFLSRKLIDKKPGLIIDDQGIIDNTTIFKFGLIPWRDISGIYERSIQVSVASKQSFITIALKNPDEYISRETNAIKRKLIQANANSYGSPVHISTNGLKMKSGELIQILHEAFEKNKHKG